jgi:hypothetical protein
LLYSSHISFFFLLSLLLFFFPLFSFTHSLTHS